MFTVTAMVATLVVGQALAHWEVTAEVGASSGTGLLAKDVAGEPLEFPFEPCTEGVEACDKWEGADIGALLSFTTGDASFEITGWIKKAGESEYVGFHYLVTGGTVDIEVKSGQNIDYATLLTGSGYWVNPACEQGFAPGDTSTTCSPENTSAISYVAFCLTPEPSCPDPLARVATVANTGTVPMAVDLELGDPVFTPSGADFCDPEAFSLTVEEVDASGTVLGPPLYDDGLCALLGAPIVLTVQLDPGEVRYFRFTVSMLYEVPVGSGASFTAHFGGEQWNLDGGWAIDCAEPLLVSVAPSPSSGVLSVGRELTLGAAGTASIGGVTAAQMIPVGAALPLVIDVAGESTLTINQWIGSVLGFRFTVSGQPIVLTVHRGANVWADIRFEDENPHIWLDPNGLGSRYAITGIAVSLFESAPPPEPELVEPEPAPEAVQPEPAPEAVEPPPAPEAVQPEPAPEAVEPEPASEEVEPPPEPELVEPEPAPETEEPTVSDPEPGEEPPPADDGAVSDEPPPGEAETTSLRGTVWNDLDGDGVRDTADPGREPGVGGVTVRLLDADGQRLARSISDSRGRYDMGVLDGAVTYLVEVEAPVGWRFTAAGKGGVEARDSDIVRVRSELLGGASEPTDVGRTGAIVLEPGDNRGVADAGLIAPPPPDEVQEDDAEVTAGEPAAAEEVPPAEDATEPDSAPPDEPVDEAPPPAEEQPPPPAEEPPPPAEEPPPPAEEPPPPAEEEPPPTEPTQPPDTPAEPVELAATEPKEPPAVEEEQEEEAPPEGEGEAEPIPEAAPPEDTEGGGG